MRVQILGPLQVVDGDGTDVSPRGAQQRRALTALAAHAPGSISVDALEDVLWPAGAPSANALQAVVSKLRRIVAPGRIEADTARSYTLVDVSIDRVEFDRALADERWDEVERLVVGRPLDDLDGHPTVEPVVAGVLAGVRRARSHRLRREVADDPGAAIAELESLVVSEPTEEEWWELAMRAQAAVGRRADALQTFQRARRALADELGLEPGSTLRRLEAELLADDDGPDGNGPDSGEPAAAEPVLNLPRRVGSFIGRSDVKRDVHDALDGHRLVTLVGPGGAGKTTTALEVGAEADGPAAFVALAAVDDRSGVLRLIGRSIGLVANEQSGVADDDVVLERIGLALGDREIALIVDNAEHVIDDAAAVVRALLSSCSGLRVLATSRSPLGVPGERVLTLPPLPIDEAEALLRTRAADHGVELAPTDSMSVRAICDRLDGLPLAIELAAARLRTLTPDDVAAGLDDRFALLSVGPRQAEPRQQTLRAVVDWSHDLLDDVDRIVFRRLAVFVGGFSMAAAVEVCIGAADGVGVEAPDAERAIERLVDRSLLIVDRSAGGVRFSMLQTLHAYAVERLDESGERGRVRRRHAQRVADDLQPALRGLLSHEQPAWFERLRRERPNRDAALATALETGDGQLALEIVTPVGWHYYMAGELDQGLAAFGGALDAEGQSDPGLRGLALGLYGWLLANGPDVERALAVTSEAVALIERVDDPFTRGLVANTHVMALFFSGQIDAAGEYWPEAEALAEESGDRWIGGITRVVRGEIAQFEGDIAAAERNFTEAAEIFEAVGDRFAYALAITEASELAEQVGDYDRALEQLHRGVEISTEVGFSGHPLAMRARIGNVEILRGNLDAAERTHRELIEHAQASGVPWLQSMANIGLANIARRRGDYATAARMFEAAWSIRRTRNVPYMRSIFLVQRGYLAEQEGRHADAAADQLEALSITRALGAPRGVAFALEGLAGALSHDGPDSMPELASSLLGCAHALRLASGGAMPPGERYDLDRVEGRLRSRLGDAPFERVFASGAVADPGALEEAARRGIDIEAG